MVSNLLEIGGLVLAYVGCFLLGVPVGLIAVGLSLVVLGYGLDRRGGKT